MAFAGNRDLDQTRAVFAEWLADQLGTDRVELDGLDSPEAGYSNETIFITAHWAEAGLERSEELVLRIEPTGHQLFVKPDAILQAAVMSALDQFPGTPAPKIWFTESDASLLGAPFYVMQRIHGRIPGDVPSFHVKGWTAELTPDQVGTMYETGLTALAELHRIDWHQGFEFLDGGRAGHALESYLVELQKWWEWSEPSRQFDPELLEEAYRFVLENPPADPLEGVVWGDARVGNLIYDDELNVIAMLDWETATLGPPGIDLGWWLMFEDFLSEGQNKPRLAGSPNRAQMIDRYQELAGRREPNVDYYELLACVVMAMINSKLGVLLRENQGLPDKVAGIYARRVIAMAHRRLEAIRQAS